ncbi:MAG: hypothetical protein IKQ41_06015 [Clostridia bacterium]|nr:hypothetical protein [Clostridia bacterium]
MSAWREAYSPALNIEEAALLSALPRHMAVGAALKHALEGDADTEKKQRLAKPAFQSPESQPPLKKEREEPRVRAALRHVVTNGRGGSRS